jgi:hypothetical protein
MQHNHNKISSNQASFTTQRGSKVRVPSQHTKTFQKQLA